MCIAAVYWITSSAVANSVSGMVEAECFGGLQVDHKIEIGRLHHQQTHDMWKIAGSAWRAASAASCSMRRL